METKTNIAKAILQVMQEVKGIDKTMTIGSGNNSYKGVPDQEVKKIIGEAMTKAGLCILPIGVTAKAAVDRWEDHSTYNGVPQVKSKQQVFTEVTTKYLLLHESGESIELEGYGQGVDSQDKSAGKATTYALKYALLYTFLIPTGKIDDADAIHSDTHDVAPKKAASKQLTIDELATIQQGLALINTEAEMTAYFKELDERSRKDNAVVELFKSKKSLLTQPA